MHLPRLLAAALLSCVAALIAAAPAHAHQSSVVYADVQASGRAVDVTLQIGSGDLYEALGLEKDRPATTAEADAGSDRIVAYLLGRLVVTNHGHACPGGDAGHTLLDKGDGSPGATAPFFYVQKLRFHCARSLEEATLTYSLFFDIDPRHQCLLRLHQPDRDESEHVFRNSSRTLPLGRPLGILDNVRDYLALGVEHIFTGYDHLAFLFALLLIAAGTAVSSSPAPSDASRARRGLGSVVRVVTAFTLAHSVTLCLSGLGLLSLPSRFVESFIAASIGYVAVENIVRPAPRHRFLITFLFGLIHGFGFASVLQEVGLPRRGLLLSLLSFNVGVELGQLVVVALAFPVLFLLATHSPAPTGKPGPVPAASRPPFRPFELLLTVVLLSLCALLFARFDLPIIPIAVVAFALPALLLWCVPRYGYDRPVRIGVSALLAALSLLWLLERATGRTLLGGLLG